MGGSQVHLERLRLERFRSFENGQVFFHRDLTAIVGENNSGKSNIIDAIRLLFQPTNSRRDIYCEESDIRKGIPERSFVIKGELAGLSAAQRGLLASAVPNQKLGHARYGLTFAKDRRGRFRPTHWCGQFEGTQAEPGSTDLIRHVYLPPLRDAQRALASGNPTRIVQLLRYFLAQDGEVDFVDSLKREAKPAADREPLESDRVLGAVKSSVDLLLRDLTAGAKEQQAVLGFSEKESLHDIARDLRFKLSEVAITPEELRHSGLGYANLLFMATVIMELENSKEADLTLFLVEEPEAHLHPQLQMLVLDFLRDKARKSAAATVEPGQPEGRIQVIVTSHSPNITAWIDPENLVVARAIPVENGRPRSLTLPVKNLGVSRREIAKVSRYLDVTRSALLFGGRVILIEGMAEALLLPVFAELVFANRHDLDHPDRYKWKRFKSSTLVSIEGVDFEPYVQLLLKAQLDEEGAIPIRIADKVIILTDRDPDAPGDREVSLTDFAAGLGAGNALIVRANQSSFEKELFTQTNAPLLKAAFFLIHPRSQNRWQRTIEGKPAEQRSQSFWKMFDSKTNPVRKGDYAQALASLLLPNPDDDVPANFQGLHPGDIAAATAAYAAARNAFEIPAYIRLALEDIVAVNG
jgi:putative ATP-dependent endonuclease of OLD family